MSALPQTSTAANFPAGTGWIDLPTAAARSGKNIGSIRRDCGDKYAARNLAKLEAPPEGGKPRWLVHETADPQGGFAKVKSTDQLSDNFDRRHLTENQRQQLEARERVVRQWIVLRAAAIERGQEVALAREDFAQWLSAHWNIKASSRTIHNYYMAFIGGGVAALVDERWQAKKQSAPLDDPFLAEVKRLYLDPVGRSKQLCFDKARELAELPANQWPVPTYRSVCRALAKIPPRVIALKRGGDEAYNAAASCNTRDYSTIDSNQLWCGDHHRFDVSVEFDGKHHRPWLTAWMDMRSRLIVGWRIFLHDPNQDTIIAALVEGGRRHGFPHEVLIDNGRDYDSQALQGITKKQRRRGEKPIVDLGVFGNLQIKVHHAQPYRPQSKTIERFFGTVCERFSKLFETYCGGSPDTRPHNHQDQLKAGKAPSLAEFTQAFADWLEADYHARAHGGDAMDGLCPAAAHAANLKSKRVIGDDRIELVTMKRTPLLKVGRNGVVWRGLSYGRGELSALQGQQVFCRIDDSAIHQVHVYRPDGKFLAIAPVNQKIPVNADRQLVREATAESRHEKRVTAEYHQVRMRLHRTLPQRLRAKAAEHRLADQKAAGQVPSPSLAAVRTPLDDQLPAIQKAMERRTLKIAAGAESMSEDPRDTRAALDRVFSSPQVDAGGDSSSDTFMKLQTAMSQEDCDE
jgi:putative transposase